MSEDTLRLLTLLIGNEPKHALKYADKFTSVLTNKPTARQKGKLTEATAECLLAFLNSTTLSAEFHSNAYKWLDLNKPSEAWMKATLCIIHIETIPEYFLSTLTRMVTTELERASDDSNSTQPEWQLRGCLELLIFLVSEFSIDLSNLVFIILKSAAEEEGIIWRGSLKIPCSVLFASTVVEGNNSEYLKIFKRERENEKIFEIMLEGLSRMAPIDWVFEEGLVERLLLWKSDTCDILLTDALISPAVFLPDLLSNDPPSVDDKCPAAIVGFTHHHPSLKYPDELVEYPRSLNFTEDDILGQRILKWAYFLKNTGRVEVAVGLLAKVRGFKFNEQLLHKFITRLDRFVISGKILYGVIEGFPDLESIFVSAVRNGTVNTIAESPFKLWILELIKSIVLYDSALF